MILRLFSSVQLIWPSMLEHARDDVMFVNSSHLCIILSLEMMSCLWIYLAFISWIHTVCMANTWQINICHYLHFGLFYWKCSNNCGYVKSADYPCIAYILQGSCLSFCNFQGVCVDYSVWSVVVALGKLVCFLDHCIPVLIAVLNNGLDFFFLYRYWLELETR